MLKEWVVKISQSDPRITSLDVVIVLGQGDFASNWKLGKIVQNIKF